MPLNLDSQRNIPDLIAELDRLRKVRTGLLAALKDVVPFICGQQCPRFEGQLKHCDRCVSISAAIAAAEEE